MTGRPAADASLCDEMLDVPLALVPSRLQKIDMVFRGQVRRKKANSRERNRPAGQELEDPREQSRRARRLDAAVGGVFGEVQDLGAVGEERRAAFAEVESSRVDFHQTGDEVRRRLTFADREPRYFLEQILIGQLSGRKARTS